MAALTELSCTTLVEFGKNENSFRWFSWSQKQTQRTVGKINCRCSEKKKRQNFSNENRYTSVIQASNYFHSSKSLCQGYRWHSQGANLKPNMMVPQSRGLEEQHTYVQLSIRFVDRTQKKDHCTDEKVLHWQTRENMTANILFKSQKANSKTWARFLC